VNTSGVGHESAIVQLTKTAVEAAKSGRWDLVVQCYRDRGILLEATGGAIEQRDELLEWDRQVSDHVQITQALVTTLLGEATARKFRLQGLRQRLGVPTSEAEAISVEV
jgi:hypothetical protein